MCELNDIFIEEKKKNITKFDFDENISTMKFSKLWWWMKKLSGKKKASVELRNNLLNFFFSNVNFLLQNVFK